MLIAACLLRVSRPDGFYAILWLFAVVWGADVMAYFGGRLIGGPKLWPRLSPNKTWSGFVVGVLCGAAAGLVAAPEASSIAALFCFGLVVAVALARGRSVRIGAETALWRQGFEPSDPWPRRPDGSAGRLHRRSGPRRSAWEPGAPESSIWPWGSSIGDLLLEAGARIRRLRGASSFWARPARSGVPARR